MRKLKEIARLRFEAGRTFTEIASAAGVARSTVQLAVQRMTAAGLSWPWPEALDEIAIEAQLFPPAPRPSVAPPPDFGGIRSELGRKGVTRRLLSHEYRERHPEGLSGGIRTAIHRIDVSAACVRSASPRKRRSQRTIVDRLRPCQAQYVFRDIPLAAHRLRWLRHHSAFSAPRNMCSLPNQ